MRVLVTGGVRSGKSHHAETLLSGQPSVTYVAPGPTEAEEPDPDWARRLEAHRLRRPAHWVTLETTDLAEALVGAQDAVLIDCLGTWLTRTIDRRHLWEAPAEEVTAVVREHTTALVGALDRPAPVVLVTNEVGLGVVPAHRSGRLFRDLLGEVNRSVATACDEVHLVVAGRVLVL
ncbi:bifunctional adenosylcobinamide kinase/adenosylcobinamide-phosphate guanylyltransferase [Ornithinimicrobium sp. F0845]|uniref:bifunctional adenosylcobinamide kinase/adenosylcobinamide-phosphate guanylyltransferase n=1 Tax=Ornithinimicrobium sp. F0845 TaxID=2926412 RepID=UPI001FF693AB|nr:bifunctional adenosylcobinamide kinase/adenosylcobinamide-phosphate guanylyltransferase [Ornithinimicrobium sp. F0845]MCK0111034.1 bifunctional adenosylcobinamide kinase/adenosylcobinamide-phosphate guanylyltransferase [Ornithinimicrobium sp. F0845]